MQRTNGTATQTSLTDQQKDLQEQIETHQKQIDTLEGKLRGYATLGDLLRESKAKCEMLKLAKNELEEKLCDLSLFDRVNDRFISGTVVGNPRNLHDKEHVCKEKIVNGDKITVESKDLNIVNRETILKPIINSDITSIGGTTGTSTRLGDSSNILNSKIHTSIDDENQFSNISSQEKLHVLEEMKGPLTNSVELNVRHSDISESRSRESYPVQESITLDESENHLGGSNAEHGLSNPPNHENVNSGHVLQKPVNDIAQGFVHVPSKHNLQQSHENSLNLIELLSISSSYGLGSELSSRNSYTGSGAVSTYQAPSIQLERLADTVNTERDQIITNSFSRLKIEIETLEDEVNKNKKMSEHLLEENSTLKVQFKEALASQTSLTEQRTRLLEKIQQMEHDRDILSNSGSLSSQTQVVGWVNVTTTGASDTDIKKKPLVEQQMKLTSDNAPLPDILREIERLTDINDQLMASNQKWIAVFGKLQADAETKISRHRQESEKLMTEINQMKIKLDAKNFDFEQLLSASKQHYLKEESAKCLQDQVSEMTSHQHKHQLRIEELEKANVSIKREKQALEAELTILRDQEGMHVTATKPVHSCSGPESTQTVITVLRAQIALFQDDFEKERRDRARAQSDKDLLSSENETLLEKNKFLEEKIKDLDRQMSRAESNVSQTLNQNQVLQQEISSLKNKLRMEKEIRTRPVVNQYYPQMVQTGGYQQHPGEPQAVHYHVPPQQQYVGQLNPSPAVHQVPLQPKNQAQNSPELLPGAWKCRSCTFCNFPTRTICEICGFERNFGYASASVSPSHQQLFPRGEAVQRLNNNQHHFGISDGDLQTDNGLNLKT